MEKIENVKSKTIDIDNMTVKQARELFANLKTIFGG